MTRQKPRHGRIAFGVRTSGAMRLLSFFSRILKGQGAHIRMDADQWDRQFAHGKWRYLYDTPNQAIVAWLIEQHLVVCGIERPHVLDVGCGNGALPKTLAARGVPMNYTGVDISAEAIRQAKEVYPSGTFVQASMESPLPVAGSIDIVVFNEVLYYGNAAQILASHLARLNDGGTYIISMYRTLRTRYVWWAVRTYTRGAAWYSVHDATRNVTWDICVVSVKRE